MGSPRPRAEASGSRPVSRILSGAAIHLGEPSPARSCRLPGTRRAASSSLLALHRVGLAEPARHRAAGALLPHRFTLACALAGTSAVCFLLRFPSGFPAWELPSTLPCGVRTFLTARGPCGCLACAGDPTSVRRPARVARTMRLLMTSIRAYLQVRAAQLAPVARRRRPHRLPDLHHRPAAGLGAARGGRLARAAHVRHRARRRDAGHGRRRRAGLRARRRRRRAPPPAPGRARARAGGGRRHPPPRRLLARRHARSPSPTRRATAPTSTSPSSTSRRASGASWPSPAAGRWPRDWGRARHPRGARLLQRRPHAVPRRPARRAPSST